MVTGSPDTSASAGLLERFLPRVDFDSYEDFKANFRIAVPEVFNFGFDVVDEYARIEPDKIALVYCDDHGREETFTFADMSAYSNRVANVLLGCGIRKGDAVMLMLKRHFEFWFCLVALHKIGAICIPATHMLTARDLEYRNNAADVKMIIAANDERVLQAVDDSRELSRSLQVTAVARGAREGWVDFSAAVEVASPCFERPTGADATCNEDPFLLYFTSGTTGMPKMVLHDHTYPLGHILTAKYWQNVRNNGLHLTVADTGWAKMAWGKIYGQWIAGSAVMSYDYDSRFDPRHFVQVMEKHRVTTFCGPATVYRMMIQEDCLKYDLSSLQYLCVAGEPLYPEVFNNVQKAWGLQIMEGFGQTEGTVAIANYPWMEPKPGSMGKPSPGYEVDLVDDRGKPVGVGEQGHIVFRTDQRVAVGMFNGYYRAPDLTQSVWHDGIYYTGDIAYRDSDGYYWYVGRSDDAIKSSGYKIGPFEVESALQEHPAVRECAVTGVPDEIRGQAVKATIVLSEGHEGSPDLIRELQEHVKTITAPYKYPRLIEFVEALPRTISGKVMRVEIRKADELKRLMSKPEQQ